MIIKMGWTKVLLESSINIYRHGCTTYITDIESDFRLIIIIDNGNAITVFYYISKIYSEGNFTKNVYQKDSANTHQ